MSLALAILSCLCGALAAYYWYRSAMIQPMPTWADGENPIPLDEPVIKTLSQNGWIAGTVKAVMDGAYWNKRAALWSATSVLLSALSSLTAALSH